MGNIGDEMVLGGAVHKAAWESSTARGLSGGFQMEEDMRNNEKGEELVEGVRLMYDCEASRTHHLLKHCLTDGQRLTALEQFGTNDVKEAARDISKMGQRELQNKFKLVYGNTTHSNNNDWLRRKLYEAIGAAPVKVPSKPRVKKSNAKPKKQRGGDISMVESPMRHERRTRRSARMLHAHSDAFTRYRRGVMSLPSSPMGRSVIDIHRYMANDVTTSASDDEVAPRLRGEAMIYHSPSMESGSNSDFVAGQDGLYEPYSLFEGPSSLPLMLSDDTAEMELLNAYPKKVSTPEAMNNSVAVGAIQEIPEKMPLGADDDDDIMLLPVDLSAYNTSEGLI